MTTIEDLEERLNTFEASLLQMAQNGVPTTERADMAYNKCPQVDENTSGVNENSSGLIDVADLADENSTSIEELAEMVADLEERVAALEEKEA